MYATSVAGCRQLNAQAAALASSIAGLKNRVADPSIDAAPPTPAATEPPHRATPPRPRVLTYRWRTSPSGSYRTLCVRPCDGSYYPISEATQPGNFLTDEERCQSSCPSASAKLFYHATGQSAEQMVALDGERYADMENAFRFRTEYVKDCSCKPLPWSDAAKAEYARRAVEATRSMAGKSVAAGIDACAKIAAGGDMEIAKEESGQASVYRPRARYRYSRYGMEPRSGDAGNGYAGARNSSRFGYGTRSGYEFPRSP